jgi:hypothetical protein
MEESVTADDVAVEMKYTNHHPTRTTTTTAANTQMSSTTSTEKPTIYTEQVFNSNTLPKRKMSFIDHLETQYSYLGRMCSFTLVTLLCLLFVFSRGWPLLKWKPNYNFSPSNRHFLWVAEASDTCEAMTANGEVIINPTTTKGIVNTSLTTTSNTTKIGGYLFVVHRHEQVAIVVMSLLLDLIVLKYHFTHEPHPKFRLSKKRKICIYAHLVGGALEILLGLLAFSTGIPAFSSLVAYPALICQAPTAMYQAYSVFGSKRVLIPVAQLANAMHIFAAIRLLGDPLNTEALLSMMLILHLYVWARAFYSFLNKLKIMREASYTLSIALSGKRRPIAN